MSFERFVNNPVKVGMFFLALVLMGVLSWRRLPLNLFPDIQTPRITVVATTRGLSVEEAERRLTVELERQMSSIRGVAAVTSLSRERNVVVHVDFHWGQEMEFAYLDVKKNVATMESNEYVEKIDVYRFDPNAAPLMTLAFTGKVDRVRATALVENSLKPRLETIEGVAYVNANGTSRQVVELRADDDVMAQYGLTPAQVIEAVKQYSMSSTGGVVREGNDEMVLKFVSRLGSVEEVARCVVLVREAHPIHLEDLGRLRVTPLRDEVRVRQDGAPTVSLDIYREPDANAVLTARRVRAVVEGLNQRGGLGLKIASDQSREIESAIGEVISAAGVGMLLAVVVLFLFLRRIGPTLVTAVAIPISIVATFSIMYFQGLSLNLMTLGGLALGAGMLVDNAIVVIENIFRHRQEGRTAREAAELGTREVAMALFASTLTTVVVFVPLVYVHGIAGILFRDQALTVVYSLTSSLLVALVLIPMLGARVASRTVPVTDSSPGPYSRFLRFSLRLRWLLLVLFAGAMLFTWQRFQSIPVEFFPPSVGGRLSLAMEMPPGTTLEETERAAERLESRLLAIRWRAPELAPLLRVYEAWRIDGDTEGFLADAKRTVAELKTAGHAAHPAVAATGQLLAQADPEAWARDDDAREAFEKRAREIIGPLVVVESVTTVVGTDPESLQVADESIHGPNTAQIEVALNPDNLRELASADLIGVLRDAAAEIPGLQVGFESRNAFMQQLLGRRRGDVVLEVHGEELAELRAQAAAVQAALAATPGLRNVALNLVWGEENFILEPDADALTRAGLEAGAVADRVEAFLRGSRTDPLKLAEGEMAVEVASARALTGGLQGLLDLELVSEDGLREKLANVVDLRRERSVRETMRVGHERTLLVTADLDGADYETALAALGPRLDRLDWLPGTSWNVSGEEVKRRESFSMLLFAMLLAMVLVYMVIAAVLESLIHPLTIMLSVPFALAGVVGAFLWTGISLNLMGCIGIVMLVGIVVNNAIVLLDRIGQLRHGGCELREAIVQAGRQRLRPILMTSLTTILALAPMALGLGNGAELRRPMAIAVIGGLASSTLLTLWILPAIYLCVEDLLAAARGLLAPAARRRERPAA